jgi:hypothetical protein
VSNRGLANRALHLAAILVDSWEQTRAGSADRAAVDAAFLPAVRLHLCRAYGWFLLAVTTADTQPDAARLPVCVRDLPAPPAGRTLMPEVREFAILEREGWLAALLAGDTPQTVPTSATIASDRDAPGPARARQWLAELQGIMMRMDDSLSEC